MDILSQLRTSLSDRYEIEREIGRGGMATVYLARDLRHERQVAFKVLNPELGAVLGLERFQAEIKVTANLQHPNLLPLFDSGEAAGLLFYVMPFVSGESLRARLDRERQLPVDDAVRITVSIASALDYAHRNGVIHRDLKPENILLQDGQPVIADFGIALAVSKAGGARVTQTGLSLGTPEYMSPEQATGDRTIDARTDIYSLGAVLYEMLVGEPPHTGASVQAIVARVLTDPVRSVRSSRPTVPEHVDDAIQHALAKLPADRFATAKEFAEALISARSAASIRATSSSMRSPGGVASRSLRIWQGIAAVAVVAAIGAFAIPRAHSDSGGLQLARQLTFDGTVLGAAISPDGKWLAYVTDDCFGQAQSCTNTLKVREVDGTQSVQLATWPFIRPDIRWSPDGSTLLFAGTADSISAGLYLTSRLGGSIRRMPVFASAHAFDAKGEHVVAATGPGGAQHLTFIDATTLDITDSVAVSPGVSVVSLDFNINTETIAIVGDFAGVGDGIGLLSRQGAVLDSAILPVRRHVRWSPDGSNLLVFVYGPGIADDLMSVPTSGNKLDIDKATVALGQIATQYAGKFDVASNGRIVLTSSPTLHAIEVLRPAGGSRLWTRVSTRTGFISATLVSPDGNTVAADATDNLGDNIYLFPLSGGTPRAVTAVRGTRQYAAWSASGRRLSYGVFTGGAQAVVATDITGGRERVIQPGEPGNRSMWLGDSNVVIVKGDWFIRYDTLAKKLDSLNVPDSLGVTASAVGNPVSAVAAFWSHRAGAVIVANFATRSFSVRSRSRVNLSPIEVGTDGTIVAIATERTAHGTIRRFVRIAPGSSTPVTIADVPPACREFSGSSGAIVGCSRYDFSPDVWLADRAGRSRW